MAGIRYQVSGIRWQVSGSGLWLAFKRVAPVAFDGLLGAMALLLFASHALMFGMKYQEQIAQDFFGAASGLALFWGVMYLLFKLFKLVFYYIKIFEDQEVE